MTTLPNNAPPTERRRSILSAVSNSRLYIVGAIVLSLVTVCAVLMIALLQPQNTAAIGVIIGITGPLITALIGAGGIGVLKVLDGHQSQLMAAIARQQRAEGIIEGLRENPATNLEPKG